MNSKLTNLSPPAVSTIESAIRALTKADLNRLFKYARWLITISPGSRLDFQVPEELVDEAILRTLEGKRKWSSTKSFVKHLFGVMRSCVSHSADSARTRTERFDMDEESTPEHASEDPEDAVLAAERDRECAQLLANLAEHFASDADAIAVLQGWMSGFSGPEIMELNDMTQNNFESAAKRIRRHARSYKSKRG